MSASALTAHFLDTEAVLVQLVHRLHVLEHPDEGAEPLAARLYDRRASKNSRRLASSGPASSLAAFFFCLLPQVFLLRLCFGQVEFLPQVLNGVRKGGV